MYGALCNVLLPRSLSAYPRLWRKPPCRSIAQGIGRGSIEFETRTFRSTLPRQKRKSASALRARPIPQAFPAGVHKPQRQSLAAGFGNSRPARLTMTQSCVSGKRAPALAITIGHRHKTFAARNFFKHYEVSMLSSDSRQRGVGR